MGLMAPGNRAVYEHFLTKQETQQLLFIHRALAVNGYRLNVRSLTLFDLVLAEPRLLLPLVNVRQLVLDAVEEHFDRPCQVFIEHTSLMSWGPGASIGWHHDSNREYLAQRHFSAVLYLNSKDTDFCGGTFCFQSGSEPLRIAPSAGMLLLYSADERNVHQVEPVTAGERATLTMWFTLDQAHQEDKKVLAALSSPAMCRSGLPPTMYQQTRDGPDIRLASLQQLGARLVNQQQQQQQQQQRDQPQAPPGLQQKQQQQHTQPEGIPHHQQQQYAVLEAGHSDSSDAAHVSMQQAALVLFMLQWKLCPHRHPLTPATDSTTAVPSSDSQDAGAGSAANPLQQQEQLPQQQQLDQLEQQTSEHCNATCCGCYTDPKLLSKADQLLQEYLAATAEQLEQLLPLWQQLGRWWHQRQANSTTSM